MLPALLGDDDQVTEYEEVSPVLGFAGVPPVDVIHLVYHHLLYEASVRGHKVLRGGGGEEGEKGGKGMGTRNAHREGVGGGALNAHKGKC